MSAMSLVCANMCSKDPRDGWHRPGAWPDPNRESNMPDRTCTVDGCDREPIARGWCMKHYQRWKAHGDPAVSLYDRPERELVRCTIPGCDKPLRGHGLCSLHYQRWRSHGSTDAPPTPQKRFWAQVEKGDTCWIWTGRLNPSGYGSFTVGGKTRTAHRYAWEWLIGPVDRSLDLDHLCHDARVCHLGIECPHRRCVNPAHLEPVTRRENQIRGNTFTARNLSRTHCSKGHPFDEENTYMEGTRRRCKTCLRIKWKIRDKRRWAEHKARLAEGTGGGV